MSELTNEEKQAKVGQQFGTIETTTDTEMYSGGAPIGKLGKAITNALGQTQSQSFEELVKKNGVLERIKSDSVDFTSDEIVIIKAACLKVFPDLVTIEIIKLVAPNDLK